MKKDSKLNYIAEFKDKSLETEYLQEYIDSSKRNICILIMTIGIIYFVVAFVDMVSEENRQVFIFNLLIRATVLVVAIVSSLFVMKGTGIKTILASNMIFIVLVIFSYQMILFLYEGQAFLQQGMTYLLMIYGMFLIPNRWIYAFCLSIGVLVMFFAVTPFYIDYIPFAQRNSVFVCQVSAIALGSISSHSLNKHRRLQFFKERQLEVVSNSDYLTGTYNRKKFDEIVLKLLSVLENEESGFSIIMFDLDNFKCLNDTHGHIVGDKVLTACADTVLKEIRKQEILARWGGEEFMILLPRAALKEAVALAERLRLSIEKLVIEDGVRVTASFGVTDCHKGDTIDTIISRVDNRLYNAKQTGKNCVSS